MSESNSRSDVRRSIPFGLLALAPIMLALPWACRERVLDVLGPMPSASPSGPVGPRAGGPPFDPGPPGVAGGGASSTSATNPAECINGLQLGDACTTSSDCCSGSCGLDASGRLSCRPAVACGSVGASCLQASECCSLSCVATEGGRICADFGYCTAVGEPCTNPADCCSSRCEGGRCMVPSPQAACSNAGELCANPNDCCGLVCTEGTDERVHCQLLPGCRVEGETCSEANDCCSGLCQSHPAGVNVCVVEKKCTQGNRKDCARQVGDTCKNAEECCSKVCAKQADGSTRCTSIAACRSACELCSRSSDCCSGSCKLDPDGKGRCVAGACLSEGELCENSADCCQTDFAQVCVEDLPGTKVKHCLRDPLSECLRANERCSSASLCCDQICAPDENFESRCASYCSVDGQPCSRRTDCCGYYADCVVILGERVCATIGLP